MRKNSKNREESECFGSGYFLNWARALWPIFPVCTRPMEDYKKTIPPQQRVRTILSSKSNIRRSTHINFLKFDGKSFNSLVKKSHCFSLFQKLDKNTSKILKEIWIVFAGSISQSFDLMLTINLLGNIPNSLHKDFQSICVGQNCILAPWVYFSTYASALHVQTNKVINFWPL